jgi:VWFA-related protein
MAIRRSTPNRWAAWLLAAAAIAAAARIQAQQNQPAVVFRSGASVVSVDVVVRDASGNLVRGLRPEDFTILEDGRPQRIQTFSFEEIVDRPAPLQQVPVAVLAGVEERLREQVQRAAGSQALSLAGGQETTTFAGRRLVLLLFDISSMQPEEVQRAVESALAFTAEHMSAADLVAVATVGSTIDVLADFTADREVVRAALQGLAYSDGTAVPPARAETAATEEAEAQEAEAPTDEAGFETFNNDVRLRALKTIAETLAPIAQKKAIIYFSAGMGRAGEDNQVELRAAINAAVRANVAIYPVDARGLEAIVPGGDARRASGRGVSLFSGRGVVQQFARLTASQNTLATLAADTGGRAFTDSNDFSAAFTRVQRDLSAYYLIGYASTNPIKDGRFRRIEVRVARRGVRVEAREGYYAERDFAHTSRRDREAQLEAQLAAPVSSTDLPVIVGTGWFRQAADRYYVPIAVALPGSAVPVPAGRDEVTLDVRGAVRDELGRVVGRIRETVRVPAGLGPTLAGRQVLYQTSATLPPGRFSVKVVVRENTNGTIGSFEAPIVVPQLRERTVKVSPVVLGTQVQAAPAPQSASPLVRDGVQLIPNLTRVVTRGQTVYFYYEVYDPELAGDLADIRTSLAFYRGPIKVYETPIVERAAIDDTSRRAVVFRFEVPASALAPGQYTCQVNVIDAVAGRAAFPRLNFSVR